MFICNLPIYGGEILKHMVTKLVFICAAVYFAIGVWGHSQLNNE